MIDKIESEYKRFRFLLGIVSELLHEYLIQYGSFNEFPEEAKEKFCALFESLEMKNDEVITLIRKYENNLQ